MKTLCVLLLLWCSSCAAVDLAALKALVNSQPYIGMTDSNAYAVLTTPATHVNTPYYVTDRDLYDALGVAQAEQFLGVLKALSDPAKYPYTAQAASRILGWLQPSGSCYLGVNIGGTQIRAWLDQLSASAASLKPTIQSVEALANYTTTPAQDAGIYDPFTVQDVTAARALP